MSRRVFVVEVRAPGGDWRVWLPLTDEEEAGRAMAEWRDGERDLRIVPSEWRVVEYVPKEVGDGE